MKIAYKANTIIDAHIVAGMLQSFGLVCYVSGHYLQGAVGDLSPMGFANVFVNDADMDAAEDIIREYESKENTLMVSDDISTEHKPA
jgi:Putative prokaryotic signal transducing protein